MSDLIVLLSQYNIKLKMFADVKLYVKIVLILLYCSAYVVNQTRFEIEVSLNNSPTPLCLRKSAALYWHWAGWILHCVSKNARTL